MLVRMQAERGEAVRRTDSKDVAAGLGPLLEKGDTVRGIDESAARLVCDWRAESSGGYDEELYDQHL